MPTSIPGFRSLPLVLFLTLIGTLPLAAVDTSKVPGYKNKGEWITVISPVTPQTWSNASLYRKALQWKPKHKTFQATMTFTNQTWAGGGDDDTTSPEKETYFIPFPGVHPIGNGLYGARNDDGTVIPLCRQTGGGIELLPSTRVNIFSFSGRLVIAMLGTTNQGFATNSGDPWVIYDHGFRLQNLIQGKDL